MKEFSIAGKKYILVGSREEYDKFMKRHGVNMDLEQIGFLSDLTEEQAAGIVEKDKWDEDFKDYEHPNLCYMVCASAVTSFRTFLRSIGVDESKNFLILKEI